MINNNEPKVLLLYPPEQRWPGHMVKPNGSLAYPMLGGALKEIDCYVEVYDACVGNDDDDIRTIYNQTKLDSGLFRYGVTDERILEVVNDFDIIGLTSIFSSQETMVLHCCKIIKERYPEKLVIAGGANARHRLGKFFDAGFDIVATSEGEETIKQIVNTYRSGSRDWSEVQQIKYIDKGITKSNSQMGKVVMRLDELPFPAWELLPNERYWGLRRGHGVTINNKHLTRYASIMTSLGCPFKCTYCHIGKEVNGSLTQEIGRFRIKSDERVMEELRYLKDVMGVNEIFIEDDSLFGRKKRALRLLEQIVELDLKLMNINGINIIHLLKKGKPDIEMIKLMKRAGFTDFSLPIESGNDRILKRWCSNKWDINNTDMPALIKAFNDEGIRIDANYIIGFPDETLEECKNTIEYARDNAKLGVDSSCFFICMPLPGTTMFDYCIEKGLIDKEFNIDKMNWRNANIKNGIVPPQELERLRDEAWETVNSDAHKNDRKSLVIG